MDGNRRWAKENGYMSIEGHQHGYEKVKDVVDWMFERGVKVVSLYAFSTENWNRSKEEVGYLMKLMKRVFKDDAEDIHKKGYRIVISGRTDELPDGLSELCRAIMSKTKDNKNGTMNFCINYSGHAEIVDAVNKLIKDKQEITEEQITGNLYNADLPIPDMIVRTSGERRLSGFLLWNSAYAEFLFLDKHWPALEESDIEYILEEYNKRNRRFGGN